MYGTIIKIFGKRGDKPLSFFQDKPEHVGFETLPPDELYHTEYYRLRIRIGGEWKNIQFTKDTNRYDLASVFMEMARLINNER